MIKTPPVCCVAVTAEDSRRSVVEGNTALAESSSLPSLLLPPRAEGRPARMVGSLLGWKGGLKDCNSRPCHCSLGLWCQLALLFLPAVAVALREPSALGRNTADRAQTVAPLLYLVVPHLVRREDNSTWVEDIAVDRS